MTDIETLGLFAEDLIKQKRLMGSIKNTLFVSFILLAAGSLAALPLRYFLGVGYAIPTALLALIAILAFIYGFLGVETYQGVLREADEKLRLNEKLSAAFQFSQSDNPYSRLLMEEALELIQTLKPADVFPVPFSRRDPFIPLLTGLFLFLWMSSFPFLQISDDQKALGDLLIDSSERIDAVVGEGDEKDLEELADEYRKLGQKIQDRFLNEEALDKKIDELSLKLEQRIEKLSREGVDKESRVLSDEEAESEIYQLERKREMEQQLNDVLESLMQTFSISPDVRLGSSRESRDGTSGQGEGTKTEERVVDRNKDEEANEELTEDREKLQGNSQSQLEEGDSDEPGTSPYEGNTNNGEPGKTEGLDRKNDRESEISPSSPFYDKEDEADYDPNSKPDSETAENEGVLKPYKETKQSGEFDDEENIRGDLREGEQMKSFIRALPEIVDPTKEEMDIIHFYRNQLETAVNKEILPREYETVIRDYFLAIGVLSDE